jgi:hypothetical protein
LAPLRFTKMTLIQLALFIFSQNFLENNLDVAKVFHCGPVHDVLRGVEVQAEFVIEKF